MLELSTIQNSAQSGEAKRKPGQDRAEIASQENETAFENEYNTVQETQDKSGDVLAAETPDAEEPNYGVLTGDEDSETVLLSEDSEIDTKTVLAAPISASEKDPSKHRVVEQLTKPALNQGATVDDKARVQQPDASVTKTEQPMPPTVSTKTTDDRNQPKPTAATPLSPAETAIVSKALKNAVMPSGDPNPILKQIPETRAIQADGQVVRVEVGATTQQPATDEVKSTLVQPFGKMAERLQKRTEETPRRIDEMPLPLRAKPNGTESNGIVRQQYVLTTPSGAQVKQLTLPENNASKITSVFDLEVGSNWDARSTTQTTAQTLSQVITRAETPAMIGRQMAEALQRLPDRPVEISLNPRELGRVRMNISTAEAGITISVLAERPETLDLMRRNIEQLANEFQSLGYESVDFAFSQGETRQEFDEQASENDQPSTSHLDLTGVEDVATVAADTAPTTGIDIRI